MVNLNCHNLNIRNSRCFIFILIAGRINRPSSSISREVRRNKRIYSPCWYDRGQMYVEQRKAQPTSDKRK